MVIIAPNGGVTQLEPQMRTPLHNPDLNQDYLLLRSYTAPAVTGTYSLIVIGRAPERFLAVTGFESPTEAVIKRGKPATDEQLAQWYSAAP